MTHVLPIKLNIAYLSRYALGIETGLPLGQNSSLLAAVTEAHVAPSKA